MPSPWQGHLYRFKGVEVHVCQIPTTEVGLTRVHGWIRNRPGFNFCFIPLVVTRGDYVSVGRVSLKPSRDIVHRWMLNGFI